MPRSQKRFQKTKEDFHCEYCGYEVVGDGYTNHCPRCLWSKHVDIDPGDRASGCAGLMEPMDIYFGSKTVLLHKCIRCGHEKRNRIAKEDNLEAMYRTP